MEHASFSELWNKVQTLYKAMHPDAELMLGGQNGEVYIVVVKNGELRDCLVENRDNAMVAVDHCLLLLQARYKDILARKREQMQNEIRQLESLLQ